MADPSLTIDTATLFDNPDARTVEFSAEVDGERRDFAVQYDVIEALEGPAPENSPVAAATRHRAAIETAALVALARDADQDRVTISENDLD